MRLRKTLFFPINNDQYIFAKKYKSFSLTASGSSQSSLPPSYSIPVHDHILPPGWHCKCDPKTNKYYFYNDWDFWRFGQYGSPHSSLSSSPSHTLTSFGRYFQPFTSRYKSNEAIVQRINKMFPTVEESHIYYLLRLHQNRETQVISALINEGLWKSEMIQLDEALFYKLRSYFPSVDPDIIRQLLIRHGNSEHEVIAGIISNLGPNRYYSLYSSESPQIKLRYIKLLYPEVDESFLFDLLYNYDHNAQQVMEKLEKMGYKKRDISKSSSKIVESVKSIKPQKTVASKSAQFSRDVNEKQKVFEKLRISFPKVDSNVIHMALECANLNEERARIFLSSLSSQNSEKYLPTLFSTDKDKLIVLACKATQTKSFIEIISGSPITIRRSDELKKDIINHEVGTSTIEDGVIVAEKKKSLAKGQNLNNRKGAIANLIKSVRSWIGPDPKNRLGPNLNNKKGPNTEIQLGSKVFPKGANSNNRKGPSIFFRKK